MLVKIINEPIKKSDSKCDVVSCVHRLCRCCIDRSMFDDGHMIPYDVTSILICHAIVVWKGFLHIHSPIKM